MKKIIIGAIGAGCIAAGVGFASPAQAAPGCVINSTDPEVASDGSICGIPDLQESVNQSLANLKANLSPANAASALAGNLSPGKAAANLSANLDPSAAAENLKHALTHGVGSDPDA